MSVSCTSTKVKFLYEYGYKILVEGAAVYNPGSLITQNSEYLAEQRRE